MGLYGRNATSLGGHYDVVANENYRGVDGALVALTEGYVNDQAIFEAVIGQDFAEAYAFSEGCELELVTEASLGGAFDKLKAFVKKIWEKIKGLFKSFMTKLNSVIIRDNKKFLEKYKKEVTTKNLSKMKYKWCEPQPKGFETLYDSLDGDNAGISISLSLGKVFNYNEDAIKRANDDIDDGNFEEDLLKTFLASGTQTDSSSFSKDVHDECFESEETEEGLSTTRLNWIMRMLDGGAKELDYIKKAQSNIDKLFSSTLKDIDKAQKTVLGKIPKNSEDEADEYSIKIKDKDGYEDTIKSSKGSNNLQNDRLSLAHRVVSVMNTCFTRASSALIAEAKFAIKQSRSVFAKAAAYRATNESMYSDYTYLDAVAESAGFEIESAFEDYEY